MLLNYNPVYKMSPSQTFSDFLPCTITSTITTTLILINGFPGILSTSKLFIRPLHTST